MKVTIKKYEPINAGTYHLYTKSASLVTNPNPIAGSSGDFISWTCEVIDDPDYEGREINFSMSPTFGPSSKGYEFMKALGLSDDSDKAFDFDTDDYLGIGFYAKIKVDRNTKNDLVNKFDSIWSEEEQEKILSKFSRNPGGNSTPRDNSTPGITGGVKREVVPSGQQTRVASRPTSTITGGTKREVTPEVQRPTGQRPTVQRPVSEVDPSGEGVNGIGNEDEIDFPE